MSSSAPSGPAGSGAGSGSGATTSAAAAAATDAPRAAFRNRPFSHVGNFTEYMTKTVEAVSRLVAPGGRVLDVPAGNGLLSEALRERGFAVTSGDINRERPDFAYVDMGKPLPFADASFDAVLCLEGIEHLLEPYAFFCEMWRILAPGGLLVITTPNVMSLYSRLHFLAIGTPYQFRPCQQRRVPLGVMEDRGHIAQMSYLHLRYYTHCQGGTVLPPDGDKTKRKVLYPVYLALWAGAWLAARGGAFRPDPRWPDPDWAECRRHVLSRPVMLARSLMFMARKPAS